MTPAALMSAALLAYTPPAPMAPATVRRSMPALMNANADILQTLRQLEEDVAAAAASEKEERLRADKARTVQQTKVSAFGARLDDDVAGDNLPVGQQNRRMEEYEKMFDRGNELMLRGEYKAAVKAFTQATVNAPGGMAGRKGGQYAIYLAQALQAADRKPEAVKLLKKCEAHPDGDVRKIADSVLYVMQAPELKLGAENFVTIPSLQDVDSWGARRTLQKKEDPPPEKYSLEWYVLEAEKKKQSRRAEEQDTSATVPALIAGGALVCVALAASLSG
jgi:tetratricopeptide (TPR) repeat protein